MLYVVCRDKHDAAIDEVEQAVEAQVKGELLVCLDVDGKPVHMYHVRDVLAYSTNGDLKSAIESDGDGLTRLQP